MRQTQLLILSLISISTIASSVSTITAAELEDFAKGVVSGLTVDSTDLSACATDFDNLFYSSDKVKNDISGIMAGNSASSILLVTDLIGVFQNLNQVRTSCHFDGLEFKIKSLFSEGWWYLLVGRFTTHYSTVLDNINKLTAGCTSTDCGEAAGELFRIMIGWSL